MKKSTKIIIIALIITTIASSTTAGVFGFKYFRAKDQISVTSAELALHKLALLPSIEKNGSIQTTNEYYEFITRKEFVANYKLQLNSEVNLNFRDYATSTIITAGEYGNTFSIAYVEKATSGKHSGKYCVFFAIPYTDIITDTLTTRYVYVAIDDISAKLPSAATGSFVKVQ